MSNPKDEIFIIDDSKEQKKTSATQNITILIVDDEEDVHQTTELVLKHYKYKDAGFNFLHAYSEKEAHEIFKQLDNVKVILMDVVMENNDSGLKLIKYIRENLNNSLVRIILRTGQPGEFPETEVMIKFDINDYKQKSELTAERLFTSIYRCIREYDYLKQVVAMKEYVEKVKAFLEHMINSMPSCMIAVNDELCISHHNDEAKKHLNTDIKVVPNQTKFSDGFTKIKFLEKYLKQCMEEKKVVYEKELHLNAINEKDLICAVAAYPIISNNDNLEGAVLRIDNITSDVYIKNILLQTDKMLAAGNLAQELVKRIRMPVAKIIINSQTLQKRLSVQGLSKIESLSQNVSAENIYEALKVAKIIDFIGNINSSSKEIEKIIQHAIEYIDSKSVKPINKSNMSEVITSCFNIISADEEADVAHIIQELETKIEISEEAEQAGNYNIFDIEQILLHILKNAVESLSKKPEAKMIEININILKDKLICIIKDNGSGIPTSELGEIFKPEYTNKTNRKYGIGLLVVKQLIDRNNGTIDVTSQEGKGTTVAITIKSQ